MDLLRYISLGIDPKKPDYAGCTFADLAAASRAIYLYQKLGVVPSLVDLDTAFSGFTSAGPQSGISLAPIIPTSFNPTTFRLPRWLVIAKSSSNSFSYNFSSDVNSATSIALQLAKANSEAAVISMNSGLLTHKIPAGANQMPARVDVSVMAGVAGPQFVVAVHVAPDAFDDQSPDGLAWTIQRETDDLQVAYGIADTIPNSFVYDRDNRVVCYYPGASTDNLLASRKWSNQDYLLHERCMMENEAKSGYVVGSVPELIKLLSSASVAPRRSGQTLKDRIKDWEAFSK